MTTQVQNGANAPSALWAAGGYPGRIRLYFREMYPLPARLVTAILLYISFTLLLAEIQGLEPRFDCGWIVLGGLSGFCLALVLRLMDELKDRGIDRRLFPGRPVPSGRVQLADIRITLVVVGALFLILNLVAGAAALSAAGLLVYSLFMYRYFFLPPRWKAKLWVNLVTHNPVVALLLLHYVFLFSLQYGISLEALKVEILTLVSMYWALLLAWELARKVRYPEEETDYQTYSRIFGSPGATALACFVQTLALGAGLYLVHSAGLSLVYLLVLLVAYAWLIRGYACFLMRKLASGSQLRTTAEQFAAVVMSAAPVEFIFQMVKGHGLP